jgi:hypothetical protein
VDAHQRVLDRWALADFRFAGRLPEASRLASQLWMQRSPAIRRLVSSGNARYARIMLANCVSPPSGGSSTACSIVKKDGTEW